jgi:hypothetical protein
MVGTESKMRGFVYFHGAAKDFQADIHKPMEGRHAFSFNDLCWQQETDPRSMQRSSGFEELPDEWQVC